MHVNDHVDTPARLPLPIDPDLPAVIEAVRARGVAVLQAPTGAGKTTRVPPSLLDAGLADRGRVVMLEPRRLAARAAARRIAWERGGRVGGEVGYHVRFDAQFSPRTRLLIVTPGVLLRMALDDPFLESISLLVFDEFHERGLDSDLALGIARLLRQTVRPDLKLLIMSATLAGEALARTLDAPLIVTSGRSFPVELLWRPRPPGTPLPQSVAGGVAEVLQRSPGDVLVFLPGLGEIRQCQRELLPLAERAGLDLLPLHGDLPPEQQDAALSRGQRRKIILATNVAETSVTVEGVTAVVDSGLARLMIHDPAVGLDRLSVVPISRASADQRTGRAGRTTPGVCVRLWSEVSHRGRAEQTEPEIRRVDLAGAVLQLLCLGEAEVLRFPWLEPPRESAVEQALRQLHRLGALADGTITELGRRLGRLPVQPRLGRLLIEGWRRGCAGRTALAAALLSERDPFRRGLHDSPEVVVPSPSDVLDRVEALEAFERQGREQFSLGRLHPGSARAVLQVRDQLLRLCRQEMAGEKPAEGPADEGLLRALLAAFPDRVARRREPHSPRGVMVGGRGVRLLPGSAVVEPEFFLCIDVDAHQAESLVRQASRIEKEWLPASLLSTQVETRFDEATEKVVTLRRVRFEDLVIEESPTTSGDPGETARVLLAAARERLGQLLPTDESPAGEFLARVRFLREWMPELELPAFTEEELGEVLPWLCQDRRSLAEVRTGRWLELLQGRLTRQQLQALDREAPERLEVPTGNRPRLKYEPGRPPVLAVRIQELFGLAQTPRVAAGRVKVLLHLLAPNYRAQQVTDDLASFWVNTYPVVRKQLRARYPRHAWPEDPLAANPESRPRKR